MPARPARPTRPPRTLGDLAADLGVEVGAADADVVVSRVEPDLGRLVAGDLFVALPGAAVDGHDLVVLAAVRGAAAAVVARSWAERLQAVPLPLLPVDDPGPAVLRLAATWRRRLPATVVGVTGSVGKTSTKEALAAALRPTRRTWATESNRNTGLGVALTLLDAAPTDEVVVLEVGGGAHRGEVADTSALARPDVAVVTSVHPVHLASMGSVDAIAASKADLVRAVPTSGAVVLNADDARVRAMAAHAAAPVRLFGRGPDVHVGAEDVAPRGLDGTDLVVRAGGRRHAFHVPFPGRHAVPVTLAAVAAAEVVGVDVADALAGLADAAPHVRPQVLAGVRGCTVVDDAYSASPPSVGSALDLLGSLTARHRVAVLGDMRELGALTAPAHDEMGVRAAAAVDRLVTVGSDAAGLAEAARRVRPGLPVTALAEGDVDAVADLLAPELGDRTVVLVKGSRAIGLDRVVAALRA